MSGTGAAPATVFEAEAVGAPAAAARAPDAATAADEEQQGTGGVEKIPFAFSKCTNVNRKGSSAYVAECQVCGKQV